MTMMSEVIRITMISMKDDDMMMFCHLVPLPEYSLVKKVGRVARYQLRSIHYQHDDDDDDCVGDYDNDDDGGDD